ncbi:MAG: anthranilate synthase component I family protein [Planctomycetes bacterium]|nr:anthranilate synthase component I family protein [Planctomycetota bacterium]
MRAVPRVVPLGRTGPLREWLPRFADARGLALLEGAGADPGRFGWLAFDPLEHAPAPRSIAEIGTRLRALELAPAQVPGPFAGGFLGALAYDLGAAGETRVALPRDPWELPQLVGGFYTDFLVRDCASGECWLALGDCAREARVRARLDGPAPALSLPRQAGPLVRHTSAAEHIARVERVREDIAAGEYYQANLAHRFTRAVQGAPVAWFERLARVNPAPYMGFLDFGAGALLSASPELLLEVDGGLARSRPIKGTARRTADARDDRALARALLESEKDRAELAMIVDLVRNDLGRVARPGGVRVEGGFPRLESYAGVHHLLADVVAELASGKDALDALAALFPGGSITGAPKLASMAAIAREEREGRGFFSGSLGFQDVRGNACWNILIRTLVWRPRTGERDAGEFSFHVGGGITWCSDARAEEQETLLKAERLVATLEGEPERAEAGR